MLFVFLLCSSRALSRNPLPPQSRFLGRCKLLEIQILPFAARSRRLLLVRNAIFLALRTGVDGAINSHTAYDLFSLYSLRRQVLYELQLTFVLYQGQEGISKSLPVQSRISGRSQGEISLVLPPRSRTLEPFQAEILAHVRLPPSRARRQRAQRRLRLAFSSVH